MGIYIGGHAMAGTHHAVTPHTMMTVNDVNYGEVGMFINCCGRRNVPVVMVSGDTAVKKEIQHQIPDSEFVVTKEAIGPSLAKTITPDLSCELIFKAAKAGVQRAAEIAPFKPRIPFHITAGNSDLKVFKYSDDEDFLHAYRIFLKEHCSYEKGWPEYELQNE